MCHCFCCFGYIFRKINWYILSGFFTLVFGVSLAMVKTDMKNVFFFQNWHAFVFLFFFFWFVSFTYYLLVGFLFLKQKAIHCVSWVFDWSVLCLEVTCWCFFNRYLSNTFELRDTVLSLQALDRPNQKQHELILS